MSQFCIEKNKQRNKSDQEALFSRNANFVFRCISISRIHLVSNSDLLRIVFKDLGGNKEFRDMKDTSDTNDVLDIKDIRDTKDITNTKYIRDTKDIRKPNTQGISRI